MCFIEQDKLDVSEQDQFVQQRESEKLNTLMSTGRWKMVVELRMGGDEWW